MDTESIGSILEELIPSSLAESWDNPGWQLRIPKQMVTGVLLTLDVTPEVVTEAKKLGCNLLFSHHPMLFKPLKTLDLAGTTGSLVGQLIRLGISAWSAHTNLDVVPWGTSAALADALGLSDVSATPFGFGAVGSLPSPMSTVGIARDAAAKLSSALCQVAGDPSRRHQRVAVMGGSGGSFLPEVMKSEATLFITADVRYHEAQEAVARGLDLVILDHFATERPVLETVQRRLSERLPDVPVLISTVPSTPYVRVTL